MRYLVLIDETGGDFSASVPDLPDCTANGKSLALVERGIRSAIRAHIAELEENGSPVPAPHAIAKYVDA